MKEVVLIPQLSGKHVIEKLKLELLEHIPDKRNSFFNNPFFSSFNTKTINREVSSNHLSINVRDFPTNNKPQFFSGAVGEYTLNIDVDKDSVNVGEPLSVHVKITGYGNLDFFDLPLLDFNTLKGLNVYDPEVNEVSSVYKKRTIKGEKTLKYIVIPTKSGFFNKFSEPIVRNLWIFLAYCVLWGGCEGRLQCSQRLGQY